MAVFSWVVLDFRVFFFVLGVVAMKEKNCNIYCNRDFELQFYHKTVILNNGFLTTIKKGPLI
jgi:hypothetical protein